MTYRRMILEDIPQAVSLYIAYYNGKEDGHQPDYQNQNTDLGASNADWFSCVSFY